MERLLPSIHGCGAAILIRKSKGKDSWCFLHDSARLPEHVIRSRVIDGSPWMEDDGLCNPIWYHEESGRRSIVHGKTGKKKELEREIQTENSRGDFIFVELLKACTKTRDLCGGAMLHMEIVERGLLVDSPYLASSLINMYAKCGVLAKAQQVFEELCTRDTITWNALIAGYLQEGQAYEALTCFGRMQTEGISPDVVTLTCVSKACGAVGAIDKGKRIHEATVNSGLLAKDAMLGTAIVDMYAKCGELAKGKEVLRNLRLCDVVCWNALISGYVKQGEHGEVWNCLECMRSQGLSPDAVTFIYLLKACASAGDVAKGERVHNSILRQFPGLVEKDIVLGTALVDMFAKCGSLAQSHLILEQLHTRNIASWNALIAGYSQHGFCREAWNCYHQIQLEGLVPDAVTFVCMLKACAGAGDISKGRQIHDAIVKRGSLENNVVLGNALVDLYARRGKLLTEAREVLVEELQVRDVVTWNVLIAGYVEEGRVDDALDCIGNMEQEGIYPDSITHACMLRAYASMRDLDKGKMLHAQIASSGLLLHQRDMRVGNALVDMYAKCGALAGAGRVFEELPARNLVSWNALIAGYVHWGQGREALSLLDQMRCEGLHPDDITFDCILKACGDCKNADKGNEICDEIVVQGGCLQKEDAAPSLGTAMVDMFVRCGRLALAQDVFDMLPFGRDSASWSALIAGYAQEGEDGHKAIMCFWQMRVEGVTSDVLTFISVLKACANVGAVEKGMEVDKMIVAGGTDLLLLGQKNVLLLGLSEMYAKCGLVGKARRILEDLPVGLTQDDGDGFSNAAGLYVRMLLKACGSVGALDKGERIHGEIEARPWLLQQPDVGIGIGNALLEMYAKCGAPESARRVLLELTERDAISWNTVIAVHAEHGLHRECFACFGRMQCEGLFPDAISYNGVLKACGTRRTEFECTEMGKRIHSVIASCPLLKADVLLGNGLMAMYINADRLSEARQVLEGVHLRDTVSWNALISGYVKRGRGREAMGCYERMRSEGIAPDGVTFVCMLKACGNEGAKEEGEEIHGEIVREGWEKRERRIGNSLVGMYAKCGEMEKAREVMEGLPIRDDVAWSAMIGGYARQGRGNEAMACYEEMEKEGMAGNAVTMVCALKACGSVGAIERGEQIHERISAMGFLEEMEEAAAILGNALLDMYAKCGMLPTARSLLHRLPFRNVVSWNILISAYSHQKHGRNALTCLSQMQLDHISPDHITFLCLLTACSHSGLLHDAETLFTNMAPRYGVSPGLPHHSCMVMVFGFSGLFASALSVIHSMPSSPGSSLPAWLALLGACKKWGNVRLGRMAFEEAVRVDSEGGAAPFAMMASIYMAAGMPDEAEEVEKMRLLVVPPARQHW